MSGAHHPIVFLCASCLFGINRQSVADLFGKLKRGTFLKKSCLIKNGRSKNRLNETLKD